MSADNVNIQGDLTISPGIQGNGYLNTDYVKERSSGVGVTILSKTSIKSPLTIDDGNSNLCSITPASITATAYSILTHVEASNNNGKGLVITDGNVALTNTNYSSFTVQGGAEFLKTVEIQEGITANSQTHFLTGTQTNEVVKIKNTNALGYSAISFANDFNSKKIEIGYSNENFNSYIKTEGNPIVFTTNFLDTLRFNIDATVSAFSTVSSTSNTVGALILAGGLSINCSTDSSSFTNGGSITTGGGASIAKSLFVGNNLTTGGYIDITTINQPANPTDKIRFYYSEGLKSINSSGTVEKYNVPKVKGDLLTYAQTQVVLPVGTNGQVLKANSNAANGIEWANESGGSTTTTKGDLISHNGQSQVRVPVGTNGQVLKANSNAANGIEWVNEKFIFNVISLSPLDVNVSLLL